VFASTFAARCAQHLQWIALAVGAGACIAAPANGDWPTAAHDPANTRYSPLAEITPANVSGLQLAWSFSTAVGKGHEAAPIVAGDTMFVVTPFPNRVIAFDLATPGAHVKWTFDPKPDPHAQGVACCDVVNRGAAVADNRLFFTTLDNQVIALDTRSGAERAPGRLRERPVDDDGPHRRQGRSDRRQQRIRLRRARLHRGPGRRHRP
jgi:glucose dehydrogenase